jgi:geranylgeranyl diphosphate synthase type II
MLRAMQDLNQYIEAQRPIIDAALERELPPARTAPRTLHAAMRYSVFSGGKRLRPILCLAAARIAAPRCRLSTHALETALYPAVALELYHTYTLVHDDLPAMDDDDFRRGRPTAHKVYGEANAILSGDALQAMAFAVMAKAHVPRPYAPNQLVLELSRAAHSVVAGQVEDLAITDRPTAARIRFIHRNKTAALFEASLRCGAIAVGAPRRVLDALSAYGAAIGLAFQITDDLLDAPVITKGRHRPAGATCLALQTTEQARRQAKRLVDDALASVEQLPAGAAREPLEAIARFILTRNH